MNIETINEWGGRFLDFAWPMFWQSSLLIVLVFALDLILARKIRAAVRYALWLVVLVKLLLPPSLALPTSAAWWLIQTKTTAIEPSPAKVTVTYGTPEPQPEFVAHDLPPMPKSRLNNASYALLASVTISTGLLLLLLVRWRQMNGHALRAAEGGQFADTFEAARQISGLRLRVKLKMVDDHTSPAVYGLFAPVILLPRILAEKLSPRQLRTVLLHELIHLRRADVWVNCAQTFLQIVYWWHPLLWFANARIRRVREEAVDDAVMLALRDETDLYAPTLLEVAKFSFQRPRLSLGLVGIMESRSALRQRIERLIHFRAPRKAGLTFVSILGILMFFAIAVPMGGASSPQTDSVLSETNSKDGTVRTFLIENPVETNKLNQALLNAGVKMPPTQTFNNGKGILIAYGTTQQLDLIQGAVQTLNGYSVKQFRSVSTPESKPTDAPTVKMATNLEFRVFNFSNPAQLLSLSGDKSTNVVLAARSFFTRLGVDWDFPKGKSIAYNDGLGLFFVKATEQDLDTIFRALSALDTDAWGPAIHIKTYFIEVPKEGFDTVTNKNGQLTGIISEKQRRQMLQLLRTQYGAVTLAEPEVMMNSGMQTQMRATDIQMILTNFTHEETSSNLSIIPQTGKFEIGPVVDVTPYVLLDQYTINVNITASLTDFLGYDQPTNEVYIYTRAGKEFHMPTVLPAFSFDKASAHLNIYDGQTIILNLNKHFFNGQFFQNPQPDKVGKQILVLVRVTLVDKTDNRIHPDADSDRVPPQPKNALTYQ